MSLWFANISGGPLTSEDTGLTHTGGVWNSGEIISLAEHTSASSVYNSAALLDLLVAGSIIGYTAPVGGDPLSLNDSAIEITTASIADVVRATGAGKIAQNVTTGVWYDTVQQALDEVNSGQYIYLVPKHTDENIVITATSAAKTGVVVFSNGTDDDIIKSLTIDQGTEACSGWLFLKLGFKQEADLTALTIVGGGDISFDHCDFASTGNGDAAGTNPVVSLTGTQGAEGLRFSDCKVSGDSAGSEVIINFSTSTAPNFFLEGSYSDVTVDGAGIIVFGSGAGLHDVTHLGASLFLGSGTTVQSVTSSANFVTPQSPFLWLSETRVRDAANVSGTINKTGTCPYTIINSEYDKTNSVFTGSESAAVFGDATHRFKHITLSEGIEFPDATTLTSAAGLGVTPSLDDVMEVNAIANVGSNVGITTAANMTLSAAGTYSITGASTSVTATGANTQTYDTSVLTSTTSQGAQLEHGQTLKILSGAGQYDGNATANSFMRRQWIEQYVASQVPTSLSGTLGDVKASMLTPAQMATEDSTWQLCNGGSCTGTDYATLTGNTAVPDLRGYFLRGLDDSGTGVDPQGATRTLGDTQADDFGSHGHIIPSSAGSSRYSDNPNVTGIKDGENNWGEGNDRTSTLSVDDAGGAETRPKNVSVHYYIKVNN